MNTPSSYSIGEVAELTGLSVDALRYYEKIKLLTPIPRDNGGRRRYRQQDISRIRFIQRSQTMNFSLQEIKSLLHMRDHPTSAKKAVKQLTNNKRIEIEQRLQELQLLKTELDLLLNLCRESQHDCPILSNLETVDIKDK